MARTAVKANRASRDTSLQRCSLSSRRNICKCRSRPRRYNDHFRTAGPHNGLKHRQHSFSHPIQTYKCICSHSAPRLCTFLFLYMAFSYSHQYRCHNFCHHTPTNIRTGTPGSPSLGAARQRHDTSQTCKVCYRSDWVGMAGISKSHRKVGGPCS